MKGKLPLKPIGKGLLGAGGISVPVSTLALVIENRDNLEELKLDFTDKVQTLQAATLNAVIENKQLIEQNNQYTASVLLMLRGKLTELTSKIETIRKDIKSNKLYIGRLDDAVTKLETKESERYKALHNLAITVKNKVNEIDKELKETKDNVNDVKLRVNNFDERFKSYGPTITINGDSDGVDELQKVLSQYTQSMTNWLYSTVSDDKEETLQRLTETINRYDYRLGQFETRLGEYDGLIEEQTVYIDNANQWIEEAYKLLNTFPKE